MQVYLPFLQLHILRIPGIAELTEDYFITTNTTANKKHLTLADRVAIEHGISQHENFTQIANRIGKDASTVSKEIRRHLFCVPHYQNDLQKKRSECEYFSNCEKIHVCGNTSCNAQCTRCRSKRCSMFCPDFTPRRCEKLKKPPYVCNNCSELRSCTHDFYFYRANYANDIYCELKTTSRSGINQTPESLETLDRLVSPLIRQGQPLTHIYANNQEEIPCSLRTLYSYIDQGYLTAINLDLPRKVRYKTRRKKRKDPDNTGYRENRTYKDFDAYLKKHPDTNVVELDVVEGAGGKSEKVLLTMLFRNCNLMLVFLMDADNRECVTEVFSWFYDQLGSQLYQKLFPVILTDNGSSFKDPDIFEKPGGKDRLSSVFYCDPMASWQKGRLEKNHEFIRYILPKGTTFATLTQEKVTLMTNHINSITRASLNGCTPFRLAQLLLDGKLLTLCNLTEIPSDQVILKPSLLK